MTSIIRILDRRQVLETLIAGILLTLCFAPFDLIWLAPLSFYLLLKNTYKQPPKNAFLSGVLYGFAHFATSLYWIGIALTVDIEHFWWLMPFAILLIPAALSIFIGFVTLISSKIDSNKILFTIFFSCVWALIEAIRGYFPLPFPWNFLGYIVSGHPYLLQLAPILGVHLISLLVLLVSTSIFTRNKIYISISLIATSLALGFGYLKLEDAKLQYADNKVRIVQPNLEIHHMGNPSIQSLAFQTLVELSLSNLTDDIKAVIWPEASFPYLFHGYQSELTPLSKLAPPNGYLIMGADRIDRDGKIFNSIVSIDSNGTLSRTYDKEILVPFGEYIPLRNLLPFIDKIAYGMGDFARGTNQAIEPKMDDTSSFHGLVCYEAIFPISTNLENYKWLLNVTNDAWFGNSIGPYQHLAMAQFKAAEYGIPIVRAANTGISALISPYGIIISSLALNQKGVLDIIIPDKTINSSPKSILYQIVCILLFTSLCICINIIDRMKNS